MQGRQTRIKPGVASASQGTPPAQSVRNLAVYAFFILLLDAVLAAMGYRLHSPWLLRLSQCISALFALLIGINALASTILISKAGYYLVVHRESMRQLGAFGLWRYFCKAICTVLALWLYATVGAAIPLALHLLPRVPSLGMMFLPLIVQYGMMLWLNVRDSQRLATIIDQIQRPPSCIFIA